MDEAAWTQLERLANDPRASAIGEIGLDYHRNLSPPDAQRAAFARQLDLATRLALPVIVHDRDAHADVTAALLAWAAAGTGRTGLLHAFSGDHPMAEALVAAGFVISFALPVAFRSAEGSREAAAALRPGTFVVETDAPYLGPDRERRNEPTTVLRVTAELARLRGVEPEALVPDIRAAFERVLPDREPATDANAAAKSRAVEYLIGVAAGLLVLAAAVWLLLFRA